MKKGQNRKNILDQRQKQRFLASSNQEILGHSMGFQGQHESAVEKNGLNSKYIEFCL